MTAPIPTVNLPPSALTPSPEPAAARIPKPALPHLASLSTAEDFHFAGMLAASWLATFEIFIDPALAIRVRNYSTRALTRWTDFFFAPVVHGEPAATSALATPTAVQIAYLEPTYARGRRSGHVHVYGDGRQVRCPAIAPFTLSSTNGQ